ncbi:MAG: hypothetical protein LAN83_01110 [Acidobacteriia bacterium]|nr:hypothetical protein [Terriglobia bacterium]
MPDVRKLGCRVVLLLLAVALASAQDAGTTVPLGHGKTTRITFTTIDVPSASVTIVKGINAAADMVGWYANSTSGPYHAFLLRGGSSPFSTTRGRCPRWPPASMMQA